MVVDREALEAAHLVMQCAGGGFGGGMISPDFLLSEPAFYLNVRSVVLGEQQRIDKYKDKHKEG